MRLKYPIIYVCIILMVTGCYNFKAPKKPNNLISKDKMVNVLIDASLLRTASIKFTNTAREHNINPEKYLFEKYGIDSIQFASSNNYYSFYLDEYEAIYVKVKDSLEELQKYYKELEAMVDEEKKDSLDRLDPKKESVRALRRGDSLKKTSKKDTLNQIDLEEEIEKGLIAPASDKDYQ